METRSHARFGGGRLNTISHGCDLLATDVSTDTRPMRFPFVKPLSLAAAAALAFVAGVAYADGHTAASNVAGPETCWDQPNMQAAKTKLAEAIGYLEKAEHNKGGWRESAIGSARQALAETNRGCATANR
jgi:hypothetical protein